MNAITMIIVRSIIIPYFPTALGEPLTSDVRLRSYGDWVQSLARILAVASKIPGLSRST